MNKDLLKDPCSDALNPSLSKEGNALFIVGGIRWIKRCSWWGWCVASVCVCVCFFCLWASLSDYVWFRWHPECICVYIKSSLCVCVCPPGEWPASVLRCLLRINLWTEPPRKSKGSFIFYFFHRAFHVLTDECVYWLRNKKQFRLVSQIIQLY